MVKKNNFVVLMSVLMLVLMASFISAECTFANFANSTNYGGMSTATSNTTSFSSNQDFISYSSMTPQANFTHEVNQTITALGIGQSVLLAWQTPFNITTTFALRNGSTTVGSGNYSLTQSGNNWTINFLTSQFNTSTVVYNFSRTFVKTTDDLISNPGAVFRGSVFGNWTTVTEGSGYGASNTFILNGGQLGGYVNGNNFNMTWSGTTRTCPDTGACSNVINLTLFNTLATFFMIGMAVFIIFALMKNPDPKMIVLSAVAFLIMLVGLAILNGLVSSFCIGV